MKKGRMLTSREMLMGLMWLFVCVVLQFAPTVQGQAYTASPVNTTVSMGKSATFTCGVAPGNTSLNFTARIYQTNYVMPCPGKNIKYPSMGLTGNCDSSLTQITATWQLSNIGAEINGSVFTCASHGLNVTTGYLLITGASAYYLMLFGCVMGGFFGILIIFGVTYVSLKRSEKLQECFKGKPEDDVMGGVEEETIGD